MTLIRQVVVFDAADLESESSFWAGILGGRVFKDVRWHSIFDAAGEWRIGVQLAPDHVPPDWPAGNPQQVHLDVHVEDGARAREAAITFGGRELEAPNGLDRPRGHQVYASPAGHPVCICWGYPTREELAEFVAEHVEPGERPPGS